MLMRSLQKMMDVSAQADARMHWLRNVRVYGFSFISILYLSIYLTFLHSYSNKVIEIYKIRKEENREKSINGV
jgi:hypothetical protein